MTPDHIFPAFPAAHVRRPTSPALSLRRAIALLVPVLALAGAYTASRALVEAAVRRAQAEGRSRASQRAAEAAASLDNQLKAVEARAVAAANVSNARALAAIFDRATVLDNLQNEDAWKPFRAEFPVLGLYLDPERIAFLGGKDMHVDPLVASARERHLASSYWLGAGQAWMAAASVIDLPMPNGAPPAVIVLARPLDDALLARAAGPGRTLLVSDGSHALAHAGEASAVTDLGGAVGHEAQGEAEDPGQAWAAAAHPLGHGLFLWNLADLRQARADAERDLHSTTLLLWGLAGLLSIAALAVGLRRRPAPALPREQPPLPPPDLNTPPGATDRTAASVRITDPRQAAPGASGTTTTSPMANELRPVALTTEVPPNVEGTAFGRYMLLERLGEGGMGEVFIAVAYGAENFRRLFVVKRLRAELSHDRMLVGQFIDEARLGSNLVHSNIIPVYDFGKVGEEYFMAQEYILGRDMDKLTRRSLEVDGRPLPLEVVLHVAHRVLQALDYAHSRTAEDGSVLNLVHRDVSPQNVMVSVQGEVKLFDFGIVKAESRETRTQEGVVKGNVSYMAPEQAQGLAVDQRADLYALGLVLYRCLTGELLFREETAYKLLVRAATGPGEEEWARVRALPPAVAGVLERALQPNRELRFGSAAEFAAALPQPPLGAQQSTAALVDHLFGEELRGERTRISNKGGALQARPISNPTEKV